MTPAAKPKPTLYSALLAVQSEAPTLQKSAINPHFKSKYVPLDAVHEAVMPLLNENELIWITTPGVTEGGSPVLHYTLLHVPSNESLGGTMALLPSKVDPQGQGSAITYARRYSLMAVLGLVADEDDDGNKASEGRSKATAKGKSSESNAQAGTGRTLGELSDAELEEATGGKVIQTAPQAQIEALYKRAQAAGVSVTAWKSKVASLGVSGVEDFTVEAADKIEVWVADKELKVAA